MQTSRCRTLIATAAAVLVTAALSDRAQASGPSRADAPREIERREKNTGSTSTGSGQGRIEVAGLQVNGRFDLAYEMEGFAIDGTGTPTNAIRSYHHFLFLSRNRQDEWFSFSAEIIGLSFYEVVLKLDDRYQVRFGKILVPFGADPLFHHAYGGVSGVDQKLLPVVWAEHGVVFDSNLYEDGHAGVSIDNELYAVAGVTGSEDEVLELSGSGSAGTVAVGDRLRLGYDEYAASVSLYWDQYADGFDMLLWGADLSAGYGFLPWPYLNRLAVKVGFVRADIQASAASGLRAYYHFGDYLQLDYRLPWAVGLRYRTGIVAMENHRSLFFDGREQKRRPNDTLANSFAVCKRHRGFSLTAELIVNLEAAGEVRNDRFRLTAAVDF